MYILKPHENERIKSLIKMYFVEITHIEMRRNFDKFIVSPEHSTKQRYEVLSQSRRYAFCCILNSYSILHVPVTSAVFLAVH